MTAINEARPPDISIASTAPRGSTASPNWTTPWTFTQFYNPFLDWLADSRSDITLREVRLLLHIARNTWGYHRQWLELTRSDVARISGYDEAHAQKATKRLIANGVLLCKQDPGKTNRFALPATVPPCQKGGAASSPGPAEKAPPPPGRKAGGSPCQKGGAAEMLFPNSSEPLAHVSHPPKKDLKKNLKDLSPSLPVAWQDWLAEQPREQRDEILKVYLNLKEQYPNDDTLLSQAPTLANQWGVPDGKPIRNLPALLSRYWPQVRDFWNTQATAQSKREHQQRHHEEIAAAADREAEIEDARMRNAFDRRYPDPHEQKAVLHRYANGMFDIDTVFGRVAAMTSWWTKAGKADPVTAEDTRS